MLQPKKQITLDKFLKKPFQLKNQNNVVSKDNTDVNKQKIRSLKQLNVRNKTDKEIAQERDAKIKASTEAQKIPYTKENWRQQLAKETTATGDKLRVSNEPNFFDDYLNPAVMIGSMASNLGQAPLQAEQSDSILPYITSIGAPLVTGALAGLGTQTSGQFVNNLANPLAGTGDLVNNLGNKYLPNAYKLNPLAFKPKKDAYYRQIFSKNEIENPLITRSMQKNNDLKGISAYINSSEEKFLDSGTNIPFELLKLPTTESLPYFNKGKPYYPKDYTKFKNDELLLESNKKFKDYEDFNPAATNYMSDKPEQIEQALKMSGDIRVLNPFSKEGFDLNNYNKYKKDWLQGYKQIEFKNGGEINTNMNKYAQGGNLTQINEGGLHSQNPLGGVPIGQNNSVEEGETIKDSFVYSNRIFLDSNIVSQYNLPKSLIGKSVADATKMIDSKFKDRNDKISQSTKDSMLSKIAEAQEAMKPQEPEIERSQENIEQGYSQKTTDNGQMAFGGFKDSVVGQGFGEDATSEQKSAALSAGLGTLTTGLDLGRTAFGKPTQDTSGLAASAPVNGGMMIAGNALKGASAGAAFGPLGAGIGAGVGAIAGLIGSGKARKAAAENTNNFALNTNRRFADTYAMGGEINLVDPNKKLISNQNILPTTADVNNSFNTKKIVKYQPGVTNDKMGSGFYLYSKNPLEAGFDYKRDREFVKQSGMMDIQKTAQWQDYMKSQSLQPKQLAKGGKIKPVESYLKPTLNSELKATTNFYTGEDDFRERLMDSNYIKPSTIQDFKSPKMYTRNTMKPAFGQELKLFGKETMDAGVNSIKNVDLGNLARYAPIAMNAYQLSKLKKPEGEILDRLSNKYKPEYVDEKSLQNIADNAMNNSVNAISQSGASQGQIRASLIGSQLQRTKGLSDAYMSASSQNRATNDRAQTFNLGVDQINLQQSTLEKDNNARDQAAYRNAKREYITGIGEGIGGIGDEQAYKKIAKNTTGYTWDGEYVKSPDGNIVTNPTTGKPMTQEELKQSQASKDKKALGGYLIKNKVK